MLSARLLISNLELEFLSSPGPFAFYQLLRKSRWKRETLESSLSRLGSEDLIFWILIFAFHKRHTAGEDHDVLILMLQSRPPFSDTCSQFARPLA